MLNRPAGRPSYGPKVFYESFSYKAHSWDPPRRVVAKVEWNLDELFPRIGIIATNMTDWSRTAISAPTIANLSPGRLVSHAETRGRSRLNRLIRVGTIAAHIAALSRGPRRASPRSRHHCLTA